MQLIKNNSIGAINKSIFQTQNHCKYEYTLPFPDPTCGYGDNCFPYIGDIRD